MKVNVSAVIPTRNRPELVVRAVRSALNQTFEEIEVIVVVDGPDEGTQIALRSVEDNRLRVIALAESVGGSEARNVGARESKGSWVAFLDDDDEWLPTKIEKQFAVARQMSGDYIFVASQYIEKSKHSQRILPKVQLNSDLPFSEFLFCRKSLTSGTGYVQTSTWMISKKLMLAVPFTLGLKRNQDVDWLLHAMCRQSAQFQMLPEPLAIFHDDGDANRVSRRSDWKFQYDWASRNRSYFTPKAYSYFLSTVCVPDAVVQRASPRILFQLLAACVRSGNLTPRCLGFFFYYWLFSESNRRTLRSLMAGRQGNDTD